MRLSGLAGGLALATLGALALEAHAAVVLQMSDAELTSRADLIVRAQVVAARSRRDTRKRMIVTDFTLRIEERLKGDSAPTVVVTELGGRMGEMLHVVPGAPRYPVGARVVAYLYRDGSGLATLGMSQGLFIVRTLETGEEICVRDLADTVLASPDSDGVVRPHPERTLATEMPRRLATLRRLVTPR